jgi:hypothetical protein
MEIVTKMLISEETKRFAILELFRNARKAHILHCEEMKAFRNSRLSVSTLFFLYFVTNSFFIIIFDRLFLELMQLNC